MSNGNAKIIVASPDSFLCGKLEKDLHPYGITVLSAKDRKETMMCCFSNQDISLVLLDIDTPNDPVHPLSKDGLQVCIFMKAMFPYIRIFIMFTSLDASDIKLVNTVRGLKSSLISFPEACDSKADGFIPKPPDPRTVQKLVFDRRPMQ